MELIDILLLLVVMVPGAYISFSKYSRERNWPMLVYGVVVLGGYALDHQVRARSDLGSLRPYLIFVLGVVMLGLIGTIHLMSLAQHSSGGPPKQ